jgi:type I restriction enzyme S subunit
MNADRLMAHFDQISDAPDAVGWLRRFVLDLAVRGKLVEQDPGEAAGASKAPTAEEPFPLPSNWSCVPLGGVLHMINGRAFKPAEWLTTGLPIVRIQNLNNKSAPFNHCDPKDVDEKNIINTGTFLISWSGTPGTSFGAFIWQRGKAALNQHIFKCLPTGTEYLDRFLQLAINGRLDEMIAKAHGGVGLQHITKGKLEALALPLPPLAEQHRIVAKVDELMKLCDRLEASQAERERRRDRLVVASLNRLSQPTDPDEFKKDGGFTLSTLNRLSTKPEHIKQIRKAILNLAVRGKLVPQDENDRTVEELLRRIRNTLASSATTKQKSRSGDLDAEEHQGRQLPTGWVMAPFGQIARIRTGTLDANAAVAVGEYPFFTCSRTPLRIDKFSFDTAAVLLAGNGDFNLKCYEGKFDAYQRTYVLEPIHWDVRYCFIVMQAEIEEITVNQRGSAIPYLKLGDIASLAVFLPPLAEQKRIVAKVDELMVICDQLENQLESQQKGRRQLLEALLHEALEGVG